MKKSLNKSKKPINWWRVARCGCWAGMILGAILYMRGQYFMGRFDPDLVIRSALATAPIQRAIVRQPFDFEYAGRSYIIEPVADYEISGLVVSHNAVGSITDAYHTKESVDFRDLCLVWGSNALSGVFRRMQFWSEPWSCHIRFHDSESAELFDPTGLSNNHLLAESAAVRATIESAHIGDQIRLKGILINYADQRAPQLKRKSSLVRDDQGDGACEVLWVTEAELLGKAPARWYHTQQVGLWTLVLSLIGAIALFLITPIERYRRFS